jgi:hypothetical protein
MSRESHTTCYEENLILPSKMKMAQRQRHLCCLTILLLVSCGKLPLVKATGGKKRASINHSHIEKIALKKKLSTKLSAKRKRPLIINCVSFRNFCFQQKINKKL